MTHPNQKVDVLLDVHHFMTQDQRLAKRAIRFEDLKHSKTDARTRVLRYLASNPHMFRLVFTEHHAYNVRRALIEDHGWPKSEVEKHIANCERFIASTGGEFSPLSKTSFDQLELAKMGGTNRTPDTEDATIVKLAQVLHSDLIVSNDDGVMRASTPGIIKVSMETFERSIIEMNNKRAVAA
jgi:hypothetical protein